MTDHNARHAGLTDHAIIELARKHNIHTVDGWNIFVHERHAGHNAVIHFAHAVIAEFLERTGQCVTNDASREAAIADALAAHSADARNGEGMALTDGYALVPLVPTAAMIEAWNNSGADDFKISDPNYSEFTDQEWSVWKETNATKDWQAMVRAAPAAPAPKCSECKGTGVSDGRDGALIPCLACKPAPAPAAQAHSKDDGRVMMSAHGLCPTDMSHPDRMRWMAKYFRENATPAECTCPSGNGSLRHPCPAHPADAASEADKIDYSLTGGDTVYSPYWGDGTRPVEVVDVNWALRAAAVRLSPKGGIVVWPVSHLQRERQQGADRG